MSPYVSEGELVDSVVKSPIFLLIFCLIFLSVIENEVLKTPTIIVEFFNFIRFYFMQLETLLLDAFTFISIIFS